MAETSTNSQAHKAKSQNEQHREARLKKALKANMARRKAQARARATEVDENQAESDGAFSPDRPEMGA